MPRRTTCPSISSPHMRTACVKEGYFRSWWVCRNAAGSVQALLWDFTPLPPPNGLNDQVFYKQEQPSKSTASAMLRIDNPARGNLQAGGLSDWLSR